MANWIAVDWGTSTLRLWAIAPDGSVRDTRRSDQGMGRLRPDQFEAVFLDIAQGLLAEGHRTKVLICGMAGARTGWREAPYTPVPCPPAGGGAVPVETIDPRLDVSILPGLSQDEPADVMRGEETQIAGFLAQNKGFEGTVCLPGTHTKWVRVAGDTVVSFRTVMTGELFNLLSTQSVLRLSMAPDDPWHEETFATAVDDAMRNPEALTAALFAIRGADLLRDMPRGAARARLSGLLIGQELAATRDDWQGRRVAIIGDTGLIARYGAALAQVGAEATAYDGSDLVLEGLRAAHAAKG